MRLPSSIEWSLWLVRAASFLVPSSDRAEWRQEWDAELRGAQRRMRQRGDHRLTARLWQFASGSLADALWHRLQILEREEFRRDVRAAVESPEICLVCIATLVGLVALLSGFLPATRDVLLQLPYAEPAQVATITQSGIAASTRSGVLVEDSRLWRADSHTLKDSAIYTWQPETSSGQQVLAAHVSDNFFALLGARASDGRLIEALRDCRHCVVLSYEFWRKQRKPFAAGQQVEISGKVYPVAAVLDKDFWFLSRSVGVWTIADPSDWKRMQRSGVVARLGQGVTPADAQAELESIVERSGIPAWEALFDVSPLASRVHAVLSSFALALALALVIIATTLHLKWPSWDWQRFTSQTPSNLRAGMFFTIKTSLALAVVLVAGIEFTPAASITMLGGTDMNTEPLSTWLFLLGCLGVLTWSIADQRRRCRICLRRLGMAAHVGYAGSLLLDWAGTELVCIEGHGMLHVPEMASSWREPEQWTLLDDSWTGLFARRP